MILFDFRLRSMLPADTVYNMLEDNEGTKFSEAGVHLRTAAGIFERLYKVGLRITLGRLYVFLGYRCLYLKEMTSRKQGTISSPFVLDSFPTPPSPAGSSPVACVIYYLDIKKGFFT